MVNRSKNRGTAWETAIVDYLNDEVPQLGRQVERRTLSGANDKGDIAGIRGVVIEAKAEATMDLPRYVREAEIERANALAWLGVAWAKQRGKTSPADGKVVMSGRQFAVLLDRLGVAGLI